MAADSTVLREYLVALGFQVNQTEAKKFDDGLARWDKRANQLALGLVSVGVAATTMVARFAYSMEKLYFASKRTDSAVSSIQALEFGASKIGVSGDKIRGSLEAMARNIRSNPGLTGLLNSLGVKVEGRDKSDVLMDLVSQLKKMPSYVAERYANLFGIDPDTLFMLKEGLDEMKAAAALRKQWSADAGIDAEEAARASHELANQWRDVSERAGIFKDALILSILPALIEMGNVTQEVLKDWTQIVKQGDIWSRYLEGMGVKDTGGGVKLSKESLERTGQQDDPDAGKSWLTKKYEGFMRAYGAKKYQRAPSSGKADEASVDAAQDDSAFKKGGTGIPRSPAYVPNGRGGYVYQPQLQGPSATKEQRQPGSNQEQPGATRSPAYVPNGRGGYVYQPQASGGAQGPRQDGGTEEQRALMRRLEERYALAPGTLDRIWKTESDRGKAMTSPVGAKGHFGIMDATAKDLDLDRDGGRSDRDDFAKSAAAAARYYAQLLKRYQGDERKAAAAYNWGMGNVDRKGLGAAPKETRKYMDKVAAPAAQGAQIEQTNNVNITGVSDPQKAAALTREQIDQANAETIRNLNSSRVN